ncbi:MAG: PDC sensor domain-containing protein [Acidiferrobacterales bacterium]
MSHEIIELSWKDSIFRQREELARMLREPIAQLAQKCVPEWSDRDQLNTILLDGFSSIPYCTCLYIVGTDRVQISDNVNKDGLMPGHYHRNRAERPYMNEAMPDWGFLLSDAYISLSAGWPSLTALQVVVSETGALGYLGADFDLRSLPVTSVLYREPRRWRQVKGDPAIRGTLFQQTRAESPMDRHLHKALSILEELITERGIFQCQIHFSSSQATIWTIYDPLRYRILDHEVLRDPDICLVYPSKPYPADAVIPRIDIARILETMQALRTVDTTIYLRTGSINIFNGMVSLTFSCDGSHYMRYNEFLAKGATFWAGVPT